MRQNEHSTAEKFSAGCKDGILALCTEDGLSLKELVRRMDGQGYNSLHGSIQNGNLRSSTLCKIADAMGRPLPVVIERIIEVGTRRLQQQEGEE